MEYKDLLLTIAQAMVSKPESVEVDATQDERGTLLNLKVDPEDRRFVIGHQGNTATALRTIFRAIGGRQEGRISVRVFELPEERRKFRSEKAVGTDSLGEGLDIKL